MISYYALICWIVCQVAVAEKMLKYSILLLHSYHSSEPIRILGDRINQFLKNYFASDVIENQSDSYSSSHSSASTWMLRTSDELCYEMPVNKNVIWFCVQRSRTAVFTLRNRLFSVCWMLPTSYDWIGSNRLRKFSDILGDVHGSSVVPSYKACVCSRKVFSCSYLQKWHALELFLRCESCSALWRVFHVHFIHRAARQFVDLQVGIQIVRELLFSVIGCV